MSQPEHEFDLLNRWASLSDAQIANIVSEDTIRVLQRVADLLGDESEPGRPTVSPENFISTVRSMRERYAEGSRLLGNAILEASDWIDRNEPSKAREAYERFLSNCKLKFYRKIAANQLRKIL
jgi:hypothetical protein